MGGRRAFEIPYEGNEITRAARRKIDDDINELELRIRSLKMRRNELTPTSTLPPELLSKIFILLRDLYPGVHLYKERPRWIRVRFVCHRWREVALGCPSLWSIPVFSKPDLAQEMMYRSKMAALTIESVANNWTPRMFEQLQHAMGQISRIQSIQFVLERRSEKNDAVLSLLSQPAPLLEKVNLSNVDWNTNRWCLPANALSDAPRLWSVNFTCFGFGWESAIFKNRNLTTLRLNDNRVVANGACTVGQMMDALNHLPNLRILELNRSIPPCTTSSGEEKTLEFNFLERLVLAAKAPDCIFFLRHIQYPSRAIISLRCSATEVEDYPIALSLIGQHLHQTQGVQTGIHQFPVTIRSARLISSGANYAQVVFFDKTKGYDEDEDIDPIIDIGFDGTDYTDEEPDENNHILMNIYNSFDLSSLEALFIKWDFACSQTQEIRDTLGELPKLELIHVSQYLPAVCFALSESPEDPAEETGEINCPRGMEPQCALLPAVAFPALKTLVIENVDFWKYRHPENLGYVTDVLMKRTDMDVPIDRLDFERCRGVQIWQQKRLGELVVDFKINGREVEMGSLDSDSDLPWDGGNYSDKEDNYFYRLARLGWP